MMATPMKGYFYGAIPASPGYDFLLDTPEKPVFFSPTSLRNPHASRFTSGFDRQTNMRSAFVDYHPHSLKRKRSSFEDPLDFTGNSAIDSDSAFSPPTPKSSLLPGVPPPLMFSPPSISGQNFENPLYTNSPYLQRLRKNPMFQDLQKLLTQECKNMQIPTNLLHMSDPMTGVSKQTTCDLDHQVFSLHTKLQERLVMMRMDMVYKSDVAMLETYYSSEVGTMEVSRYQALCAASVSEHATFTVNNCFDEKRLKLITHIHSELDTLVNDKKKNDSLCSPQYSPGSDSFISEERCGSTSPDFVAISKGRQLDSIHERELQSKEESLASAAALLDTRLSLIGAAARQLSFSASSNIDEKKPSFNREITKDFYSGSDSIKENIKSDSVSSSVDKIKRVKNLVIDSTVPSLNVNKHINVCSTFNYSLGFMHHQALTSQNKTASFLMEQVQNDMRSENLCDTKNNDLLSMAAQYADIQTPDSVNSNHGNFGGQDRENKYNVSSSTTDIDDCEHFHKVSTEQQQCDSSRETPTSANAKSRTLNPESTRILTEWYEAHVRYPYPSDAEVQQLCDLCGLKKTQIKKWMANKRVRSFNTLSISGNQHPIKLKYKGRDPSCPAPKPNYTQLCPQARDVLAQWYERHAAHPYPTEEEKTELAKVADISIAQVRSWFANKRSRAHNTKRQIPNYFIKKYPEYSPIVQMVSIQREEARRGRRRREQRVDYYAPY